MNYKIIKVYFLTLLWYISAKLHPRIYPIGVLSVLVIHKSPYLLWNYNHPETAVIGVGVHSFEWIFARIAPFVLIGSIFGAVFTRKNRNN